MKEYMQITTVEGVLEYLSGLPKELKIATEIIKDKSVTVMVNRDGVAECVRSAGYTRIFFMELPIRHGG